MINSHDKGVLQIWPVIIIIILLVILLVTEVLIFFLPMHHNPEAVMINDMVFEIMYTLLNIETYLILLNMVIDFRF